MSAVAVRSATLRQSAWAPGGRVEGLHEGPEVPDEPAAQAEVQHAAVADDVGVGMLGRGVPRQRGEAAVQQPDRARQALAGEPQRRPVESRRRDAGLGEERSGQREDEPPGVALQQERRLDVTPGTADLATERRQGAVEHPPVADQSGGRDPAALARRAERDAEIVAAVGERTTALERGRQRMGAPGAHRHRGRSRGLRRSNPIPHIDHEL
jgi:hypothetical protein